MGLIDSKYDWHYFVRNAAWSHQGVVLAVPQIINRLHVTYTEGRNASKPYLFL